MVGVWWPNIPHLKINPPEYSVRPFWKTPACGDLYKWLSSQFFPVKAPLRLTYYVLIEEETDFFFLLITYPLHWIYYRREMRLYIRLTRGWGASRSHGKACVRNNRKLLNQKDRKPMEKKKWRQFDDSKCSCCCRGNKPAKAASICSFHASCKD